MSDEISVKRPRGRPSRYRQSVSLKCPKCDYCGEVPLSMFEIPEPEADPRFGSLSNPAAAVLRQVIKSVTMPLDRLQAYYQLDKAIVETLRRENVISRAAIQRLSSGLQAMRQGNGRENLKRALEELTAQGYLVYYAKEDASTFLSRLNLAKLIRSVYFITERTMELARNPH